MTSLLLTFLVSGPMPPTDNPLSRYGLKWTDDLPWHQVIDISQLDGDGIDAKLEQAQAKLSKGGGVIYFAPGTYRFQHGIVLKNGIILRGAATQGSAHEQAFAPSTKFEFPQYNMVAKGNGTPIDQAFHGITVEHPGTDSNLGMVDIAINCGHINWADDNQHHAGINRIVVNCIIHNAAVADPGIPSMKIGQKPWQRFTARHHAAIDVKVESNLLIANNRLPQSGEANFTMNGYTITGRDNKPMTIDKVVFDYDNRPGIYANHYSLGDGGGAGKNGTPESHPHGFRKGIVIRDNYIFNTGRTAIGFSGDGTICDNNVIRFQDDVWRPTTTGTKVTSGASTNDNRAVEMRGWRWQVTNNNYLVYRNWAYDHSYKINDGEGLMHEDHVNSTIKDSVLMGNVGNAYLSLYKCSGIDGLRVIRNTITLDTQATAIYVNADRNSGPAECRNVSIEDNQVSGGGILIQGSPALNNRVTGNICKSAPATILNRANATLKNNQGFQKE